MENYIVVLLAASIPAFVTIIGFIISYFANKRSFAEEAKKQKRDIQLEKMSELPYQILDLLDKIRNNNPKDKFIITEYQKILTIVLAYGLNDAIRLAARLQEINSSVQNGEQLDIPKNIICYLLLLCQIKYDLTGTKVSPECWYQTKMSAEYAQAKEKYSKYNNEIVAELNLEKFLLIK